MLSSDGYKRSTSFSTINFGVFRSFLCVIHFLPVRAHLHNHHQEAPTLRRRSRNSFAYIKRLLQEQNKTARLAVCSHGQTPGSVLLLDRDCNEVGTKLPDLLCVPTVKHRVAFDSWTTTAPGKNKTTRFAVCPHCLTGNIGLLDRDHNTATNIRQLVEFYAGLGTSIFSRSKSSQECRPELGTTTPRGWSTVGFSHLLKIN
jgi:hypothetical protein